MKTIKTSDRVLIFPFVEPDVEESFLAGEGNIEILHPKFLTEDNSKSINVNIHLGYLTRGKWQKLHKAMEAAFDLRKTHFEAAHVSFKNSYMNEELATKRAIVAKFCGKEKSCGNKIRHDFFHQASAHAHGHNKAKKMQKKVEPYPCYYCNGWHVGGLFGKEEFERLYKLAIRSEV